MSEEKKRVELTEEELKKVNGGGTVKTCWAPCGNYEKASFPKPIVKELCGNCKYCNSYIITGEGAITSNSAECSYPTPVHD